MNRKIQEIERDLTENQVIEPHKTIKPVRYYVIFGILWILFSDRLLGMVIGGYAQYQLVQTLKGMSFILVTALILRTFIRRDYLKFEELNSRVSDRNQQLLSYNEELIAMEEELHQKLEKLYETTDALTEQKKYVYEIYNSSNAIIMVWNLSGEIIDVNTQFTESLGYTLDEVYQVKWLDFLIPESAQPIISDMIERLKVNYHVENVENRVLKKNGDELDVLWNDTLIENPMTGDVSVVSFGVDITKQRRSERALQKLAYTDSLTGLQNHIVFQTKLQELIEDQIPFTVYYIDIDDFKNLNDIHGHPMGNQFLKLYADQLVNAFPKMDIFRWCEDEFLLIERHATKIHRDVTLSAIKRLTQRNWSFSGMTYVPSISVGTTAYPEDGQTAEALQMTVDMALYKAKSLGKGRVVNYGSALQKEVETNIQIENMIIEALRENAFKLYYQPLYDLKKKTVKAVELLLRWQNNPLNISTQELIDAAEKTGHILEIDEWVIENVFKMMTTLEPAFGEVTFSINLSVQSFKSQKLLPFLERMLKVYPIDPTFVLFEVTEYSFIEDFQTAKQAVMTLRKLGFKLALDDFGTRFSSLNYLVQMPFDTLKIDKSYIDHIGESHSHDIVIENILKLSRDLGLCTVAEGIENHDQFNRLASIGCDYGQGYFMAKPVSVDLISDLKMILE